MRRTVTVVAALVAVAVSAPAHATTCPLVTDAVGDAGPGGNPLPVSVSRNLDVVSVDVATGPTTVVAVLRVAELAPLDPSSAAHPYWFVTWRVAGVSYGVSVGRSFATGGVSSRSAFYREGGPYDVPAPVVVDEANATFTWTVPRSWFPELATPGATLDLFLGRAGDHVTSVFDIGRSAPGVTWTDGTTGCVPAA